MGTSVRSAPSPVLREPFKGRHARQDARRDWRACVGAEDVLYWRSPLVVDVRVQRPPAIAKGHRFRAHGALSACGSQYLLGRNPSQRQRGPHAPTTTPHHRSSRRVVVSASVAVAGKGFAWREGVPDLRATASAAHHRAVSVQSLNGNVSEREHEHEEHDSLFQDRSRGPHTHRRASRKKKRPAVLWSSPVSQSSICCWTPPAAPHTNR